MEILNKTKLPLQIPLPGGKKLRLGPGRVGQIAPKAADHPPVKKLIEAGDVEVVGGGRSQGTGGKSAGPGSSQNTPTSGVRHTGDR